MACAYTERIGVVPRKSLNATGQVVNLVKIT